ncbi:MAG: ParB/RepB/Spo0J family partition protein [Gemmataceae bacterium]
MPVSEYLLEHADPKSLRLNPANIRTARDEAEDRRLAESVARLGVLQPPGVLPDGLVAWGNRRVAAAVAAGLPAVPVIRLQQPLTEAEFLLRQFAENDLRVGLSDPEVYLFCTALKAKCPGLTNAELAAQVQKDASMLTRVFAVDRLVPAAREAFLSGAFGFSIAYEISKGETADEQHRLLAERLGGSSRAALTRPRPKGNPGEDGVKADSLRVALGGGVTVTVRGPDLTLARAAELLDRAGKEAEKARAQNLNVRTAQQVWKQRATAKPAAPAAK